MRGRFLRNPRWLLGIVVLSAVPLVVLSISVTRSGRRAGDALGASERTAAAYAGSVAQSLVDQQLRHYVLTRQEALTYAHLKGQDAFRAKLKSIYYTSKLMDMPQFLSESELRDRLIDQGQQEASHVEVHRVAAEEDKKAWYVAIVDATERALLAEAASRMGYDPQTGRFARDLVGADSQDFGPSLRWVDLDLTGPDGEVCQACAKYVKKVGLPAAEGHYSIFVLSFPLPGRDEIDTGMFGAVAPAPQLLQEIVVPALARWNQMAWRSEGSPSPTPGRAARVVPERLVLRVVDPSGKVLVVAPPRDVSADETGAVAASAASTEVDESNEGPSRGAALVTLPVLGAGSPWSLEILARHPGVATARPLGPWLAGAVLVLLLGLALLWRVFLAQVEASRLKAHLLSNISHELKTPLSLIRLYTDTLEAGRVSGDEERHKFLRVIARESKRLTHLIDNILDIQRIEQDRKHYSYAQVRPDRVVRSTVDAYRYQLAEEGFDLRLDVDDDLPLLMIDEEAIAQALINLLDNAAKYSDSVKEIRVHCGRRNGEVRISVEDRGIGIPSREQEKIFQTFYRVEKSLVHNVKGSGLGLPVVAHVARAHGGRTEVESTPGKGSTFTLCLPIGYDPESA
jgi:signal transduction histidine kinase